MKTVIPILTGDSSVVVVPYANNLRATLFSPGSALRGDSAFRFSAVPAFPCVSSGASVRGRNSARGLGSCRGAVGRG